MELFDSGHIKELFVADNFAFASKKEWFNLSYFQFP
jgi:hypothetical protein